MMTTPLLVAFLISLVLTGVIIFISNRLGLLAPVREERWHKQPKPRFGGLAIFAGYFATSLLFPNQDPAQAQAQWVILTGAAAIFILGLLDDLVDLKPYIKLIYEIAIASFITRFGVKVAVVQDPLLAMAVSVIWIVMITNAFNLLDNMDGLSGGIALITMTAFVVLSLLSGHTGLLSPALIIIGTVAGFLVFNFPPAKIFMGDCGALLIGYLLAVYSIQGTWHQASNLFLLLMTPVLLLGVPLFDTLVVSVQRILHGRSIYEGGKDHSSHRLVALGWSEKQAVLILYGVALLLGIIAVVGYLMNAFISIQVVLLLVVFLLVLGLFLSDVKVYKEQPAIEATPPDTAEKQTPTAPATFLVPYILHKRRLMEIFIDCILIVVAYISAYLLRFEGDINGYNWQLIQQSLPVILPIKLVALLLCGMYGGVWKYIDFDEIKKITVSSAIASLAAISTLVGIYRFSGFSRSLFFIDFMLFLFFVIGFRAVLRLLRESVYSFGKMGRNVLIVGAGEAGQWVLNEIRKDKNKRLLPVGIIDDDPWKLGRKLYGVSVIGTRLDIGRMVQEKKIQEIIIAIPSAPDSEQQAIVKICTTFAIPVKVLRDITSWSSVVPVPQQNLPDGSDSSRTDSNDGLPSPYGPGRLH